MLNKKVMILAIVLVSILAVSTVAAAENSTGEDIVATNDEDYLCSTDEGEVLSTSTFMDLEDLVDGAGDELYLNDDYVFEGPIENPYPIEIHRSMTIHGNGHTLDAKSYTQIFCIDDDENLDITLENIIFKNGKAKYDYQPGAIIGACTLINCTFIGNHADNAGAISMCTAINCTFKDNRASQEGGAAIKCKVINSTFESNKAKRGGAASDSTVINCTFTGNSAEEGGAMIGGYASGCVFTENTADFIGGAVLYGSVQNCSFIKNGADVSGGAIYNVSATGCLFSNNSVKMEGGAQWGGNVSDSIFISNHASYGGAISKSNASNSIFKENRADLYGGALYDSYAEGCNFTANHAGDIGGAMYEDPKETLGIIATSCIFTDNYVTKEGGEGGALARISAVDCIFTNNFADGAGGAIWNGNASGCIFTNNSVNGEGGAMSLGNASDCNFTNNRAGIAGALGSGDAFGCNFIGNKGKYGGAIRQGDAFNCNFTDNRAESDGGAIHLGNAVNCSFTNNGARNCGGAMLRGSAINCSFTGNSVEHDGGAICNVSATNCEFEYNNASDGGAMYYGDAINCNFTQNSASKHGGAIYDGTAQYCNFINNHADVAGGANAMGNAENCNFISNSANNAGAIWNGNAVNCAFTENKAKQSGGAMLGGKATNSTFSYNLAELQGGAVDGGDAINCNFTSNQAGAHGGAMTEGNAANCIFQANIATYGGAMFEGTAKSCTFVFNYGAADGSNETNGTVCDDNCSIFVPTLSVSQLESYRCGEILSFNIMWADQIFDDNATISIYKNGTFQEDYYALSSQGWNITVEPDNYTAVLSLERHPNVAPVNITLDAFSPTTITVDNLTALYRQEYFVIITLRDFQNQPITGANLKVDFNGLSNYTTDRDGQVCLLTKDLAAGTYDLHISFDDAGNYLSSSSDVQLTVNKQVPTIVSHNLTTTHATDDYFLVTLYDQFGNTLAGEDMTVYVDGPNYFTTNGIGEFKVPTNDLDANTYIANLMYGGSENYTSAYDFIYVVVKKQASAINADDVKTIYGADDFLVVKLSDITGAAIAGQIITVDLNGVHNLSTDANGQVKVPTRDLAAGTYNATVAFGGNKNYMNSSATVELTVERQIPSINVSDVRTVYGADDFMVVTLFDEFGSPMAGEVLSVDLNGAYNLTTDGNGRVNLSTRDLPVGNYVAAIVFFGNGNHSGVNASARVIVDRKTTAINAFDVRTVYGYDDFLVVTLIDQFGNPMGGEVLSVELNGANNLTTNKKGQFRLSTKDLAAGLYNATISFAGNKNCLNSSRTVSVIVDKELPSINASDVRTVYGYDDFLVVSLFDEFGSPLAGEVLSVDLNGVHNLTSDKNGQVNVSTKDLDAGSYVAEITFLGNANYSAVSGFARVIVDKQHSTVNASDVRVVYASDDFLVVSLFDEFGSPLADEAICVVLNGVDYLISDEKGQVKVSTKDLDAGTYDAAIFFGGNENYLNSSAAVRVTVDKQDPIINVSDIRVVYAFDDFLVVALFDEFANPLAGEKLTVELDGIHNLTTDGNGIAKLSTKNLTSGNYVASVVFAGNGNYRSLNASARVVVDRQITTINASDVKVAYASDGFLVVSLFDEFGRPMAGEVIRIVLNDVEYSPTDGNGQVMISTRHLDAGTYDAAISFAGNKNYLNSSATVRVTVDKQNPSINASDVRVTYASEGLLVVGLFDEFGRPMAGEVLRVGLNGVFNLTSDKNGQVNLSTGDLACGTYVAAIEFGGNENYLNTSKTVNVIVVKQNPLISASNIRVVYGIDGILVASLFDEFGRPMAGENLSIDFNGICSLTTDENGQVNMSVGNLASGTYAADIAFEGNANYSGASASVSVVVDRQNTIMTTGNITSVYNVEKRLIITLCNQFGNPLSGENVTVEFNGAKNLTTDSNGQIVLSTDKLKPETYEAVITFDGNANYTNVTKTAKITVKKANPRLNAKSKSFKLTAKTKKYTVTLKNNRNKVMKYAKVTLKVNGKTYKVKTNSKGKATFKITKLTKKGKFTATVKYNGSKCYNKLTKKVKLTIR